MKVGGFTRGLAALVAIVAGCSRHAGTALPADSGLEAEAAALVPAVDAAESPDGPLDASQDPQPDASRAVAVRRLGDVEIASVVVRSGDGTGARGVFVGGRRRLRACYERALAVDGSTQGDMMVSVGVREDGTVGDVAVGRSPLPPRTTGCFTRMLGSLHFPATPGGSRIDAKLVLTPAR